MKDACWLTLLLVSHGSSLRRQPAERGEEYQWISDLGGSVTRNAQGSVTGVNLRGTGSATPTFAA